MLHRGLSESAKHKKDNKAYRKCKQSEVANSTATLVNALRMAKIRSNLHTG